MKVDGERFGDNNFIQSFQLMKYTVMNLSFYTHFHFFCYVKNIQRTFNDIFHQFKVLKKVIIT